MRKIDIEVKTDIQKEMEEIKKTIKKTYNEFNGYLYGLRTKKETK